MQYQIFELVDGISASHVATSAGLLPMMNRGPDGGRPIHVEAICHGETPWRSTSSEVGCVALVRGRFPDAIPVPFLAGDLPVLLLWRSPKEMRSTPPALCVRAIADDRDDRKLLRRWEPRKNEPPYTLSLWMRGVVVGPERVHVVRQGAWRDAGSIGEVDITVTSGDLDGKSGLWFHQKDGTFAGSVTFGAGAWADVATQSEDLSRLLWEIDTFLSVEIDGEQPTADDKKTMGKICRRIRAMGFGAGER